MHCRNRPDVERGGVPVKHILMYRLHGHVPDSRIDEHLRFIRSFEGQCPGLIDLHCGRDLAFSGSGNHRFTHGFVMTFESMEALKAYNACDLHGELVARFRDDVQDKIVFDFSD